MHTALAANIIRDGVKIVLLIWVLNAPNMLSLPGPNTQRTAQHLDISRQNSGGMPGEKILILNWRL